MILVSNVCIFYCRVFMGGRNASTDPSVVQYENISLSVSYILAAAKQIQIDDFG